MLGSDFGHSRRTRILGLLIVLVALTVIYFPTVLRIPAAGETPYMDDVAEMQGGLSVWGTVHHTGYPLFTILGNIATTVLRAVGVAPAVAPVLYCLGWGYIALTAFYALMLHLTGRLDIALAGTLLFGLVRSVWIHNVIAEVYSMALALQVILLAIAVWRPVTPETLRNRVWLLALVGGFGVAHHRMVAFMAPGLLLAMLPGVRLRNGQDLRKLLVTGLVAVPLALIGFLPYVYLVARAQAHAIWVYNDPSTWAGFWAEFTGKEAAWLVQLPPNLSALMQDIGSTFRVILTELMPVWGVLFILALVGSAVIRTKYRFVARIALVCAVGSMLFLFFFFRAVMAEAVAMFIAAACVFGAMLALDLATKTLPGKWRVVGGVALIGAVSMLARNFTFISALTGDQSGPEAIALARSAPRDDGRAVWMLPWGPRYNSVAFSKYVTGENADLTLVKHTADFKALVAAGKNLYTAKDTFYRFPPEWWADQIGAPVQLNAATENVIGITPLPAAFTPLPESDYKLLAHGVALVNAEVCRSGNTLQLRVRWYAVQAPDADLSVFVHLVAEGNDVPLAQDDRSAPVYGWYPTTRWHAGETVQDYYQVPVVANAARINLGLYEQPTPGQFVNTPAAQIPIERAQPCAAR